MKLLASLPLLVVVGLTLGCGKPKAGDKCDEAGKRACVDGKSALYCAAGTWQLDTCKGPRGCAEEKGVVSCDATENADGDPCPAALDGFGACRADRKSRAICKGGKYLVEPCRGDDGCTMQQGGLSSCDHAGAKIGDKCTVDPRVEMCGEGGKAFVQCKNGVIALSQKCPGPVGCKDQGGGRVSCDPNGEFAVSDLCHFITAACTADGKSIMACRDGKFVIDKACPGPDGCKNVSCDLGVGKLGDPCDRMAACSDDGKSLLVCKMKKADDEGTTWNLDRKCKTGCAAKDGKLVCD